MPPTQTQIDQFVKRVTAWSSAVQSVAEAAAARAREGFLQGKVTQDAYLATAERQVEILMKAVEVNNLAASVLLKISEEQLAPIVTATADLTSAAKTLDTITDGVTLVTELTVAVGAVVVAFTLPSAASVAAAGAALLSASKEIKRQVGAKAPGPS